MATKQHLQEIVEQLGLIDLGEALFYWEKGTMEKDVNDNKRKQRLDAKATIESQRNVAWFFMGISNAWTRKERRCENCG